MYDIFVRLLAERGVTTADVCKATGIRQSTLSNWKKRKNILSPALLGKIADYFDVSLDYMMGKESMESFQYDCRTLPNESEQLSMAISKVFGEAVADKLQKSVKMMEFEIMKDKTHSDLMTEELVDCFNQLPDNLRENVLALVRATAQGYKESK